MAVAFLVVLIWSSCFVIIKASQADAPPLLFGALRALLGGLPLLAVAAYTGRFLPPRGSWGWIAVLGLTNTTLGLAGMFLSVGAVGAAIPGVLANSQGLLVAPFAALLLGETLTRGRVLGLLLAVGGIALILPGDGGGLGSTGGAALALMAAGGLAAGNLVIKHIGLRVDALTATAWQYMLGGLPLLGASLMLEDMVQVAWTPTFVAAYKSHVGGLHGHVGPRADGDPQVGLGQGRSIVDPIAHHGHDFALGLQLGDGGGLLVGQHLGQHPVYSRLPCDGLRGGPVVSGEHEYFEPKAVEG